MHSRIFQVSKKLCLDGNGYDFKTADGYEYDRCFDGVIADYVMESDDFDGDIDWLVSCTCGALTLSKEQGISCLTVGDKTVYFHKHFLNFKKALEEVNNITEEQFIKWEAEYKSFCLNQTVCDKYGFYIDEDGDLETLDTFLRWAEPGTKFYVYHTLDYHF